MLNLSSSNNLDARLQGFTEQHTCWGGSLKAIQASNLQDMQALLHWFGLHANLMAILATVGVAVLLVCCLECTNCPCREKDDLFKRHEV